MSAPRVFVLGGAGWLGSALVPLLGTRVSAPSHRDLDVSCESDVRAALRRSSASAVLNLAAAQPGAPADRLGRVNHDGALAVARAAADLDLRLVHVSTDMVLDGRTPPYADDAATDPLTDYGRSKARGEAAVLAAHPAAVCVRTSLLWDPAVVDRGIRGFANRLAAGEPCRVFVDEIRCPLPRTVLAEALVRLLEIGVRGTLNVAGREAVSRYLWGTSLLEHFDIPGRERVETIRAADLEAAGAAPRPRDLTLDVSWAERLLGMRLPGLTEVLAEMSGGGGTTSTFPVA